MPPNKLTGKHILFIGGSTGLGLAAAREALSSGTKVTLASSSQDKLNRALKDLSSDNPEGQTHSLVIDLLRPDIEHALNELRTAAMEVHGPINHIVYTAGDWFPHVPLTDITENNFVQGARLRALVPMLLAKQVAQGAWLPRSRSSSLTFTGGNISQKPTPGFLLPAFIGAGMEGAVRAMALELAPIRVNIVAPGFVDTELWGEMRGLLAERQEGRVLTGKAGQAEDVAEAYLYLVKDGNITGQVIRSEGGAMLLSQESRGR
ncbi:hypothetical protein M409DRAFT_56165 [Zasmidium cellare ATCC 36951]|uniref:Uncharacterized protein n=1 Tax=Zasmidium cellare ATCC 36951 TaxID=1080233 RepID=A0A6A6CCJ0_ZASCE|nr:uncharacterized protein M409DRAFT_56165 [Zasmidium cellare ATCC 36951]KAF2164785.1 hypothetical protein M409DRAFT_56165 [Zasmidium cellare ATCC 36951]